MPLTVTNVVPAAGRVSGGEAITITGTQFAATVRVKFGGVKATSVVRVSATQITCVAPAQTVAGAVPVTVTNDPGVVWDGGPTASWNGGANQYLTFPEVTSVSPNEMGTQGGDTLTLTGKGFPPNPRVFFYDGANAYPGTNVVRASPTSLTVQAPQHPEGRVQLEVRHPLPEDRAIRGPIIPCCPPLISGVSPVKGRPGGGTDVTISGKYFHANAQVHFDGALSPGVVFHDSTRLTATTPAHAAGRVAVQVTNQPLALAGPPTPKPAVPAIASSMANGFEYAQAEITRIEPNKGPVGGGTPITIHGLGFLALHAATGVQLGGVAANARNLVSATRITATTAAAAGAGPVAVTVQNNLGDPAAQLLAGFTFVADATVTAVDPASGPAGLTVTVQGTDFVAGATVRFGGVAATGVEVVSATAIRCTTPAHALGAVDVEVQNDGGAAGVLHGAFTYTVMRLQPARGLAAGGENVTIQLGVALGNAAQVTLDGNPAVIGGGGGLTVATPGHALGPVDVVVTVGGVPTTLVQGFEYAAITRVEPPAGPAGTTVTIHGAGFDGTTAVALDGNDAGAVTVVSAAEITVVAPAHADGPVDVVVTNAGAGTLAGGYTYQAAATVTAIDPPTGAAAGGTQVTITGTGFVEGAAASIAGLALTNVEVLSPTTLRGNTPAAAGGPPFAAVAVAVTNRGAAPVGGGNLWTYRPAPTVTAAADPALGPIAGGRAIVVTGADFLADAKVLVDGGQATEVRVVNATTIECRVPAHAVGAVGIAVQNPGDAAPGPTRAASFTYVADRSGAATGGNFVQFLRDGESFFEFLRLGFELVRAAPPDPDELTYVRLAFWNAHDDVTVGNRHRHARANHQLVKYVEQAARAGHHVELILWRPSYVESKAPMSKDVYESNRVMATRLYDIDVAMAAVEGAGRVRVYFEHSEGEVGSSIHQKIAIFSVAGVRHVAVGGLNLSNGYFGADDHTVPALAANCRPWHDAAVYLRGPATDDVEAEWMRRWRRTESLENKWYGLANTFGHAGEFFSRDFAFFQWSTVRQREIQTVDNQKVQPRDPQNTEVAIATTRSVGATYHTNIRDKVIERIQAANQYIYFENYHFCDPEIVRAIIARHNAISGGGGDLKVVIVVPHPMGPDSSFLTRRAWLLFALQFVDGNTNTPYCTRVVYDTGGGPQTVMRAACGANWNVVDCYQPGAPKATSWLENDTLTFTDPGTGAGPVTVSLHQIVAVESSLHFYCPMHFHSPGHVNTVYTHSKIAAFDHQWLVVGSANWSYRSMVYDGEISAFIHTPAPAPNITSNAIGGLLAHYNVGVPAPTPMNVEARAVANLTAGFGLRLYPYEYFDPTAALGPNNPLFEFGRTVPAALQLTTITDFIGHPGTPNYTWL